MLTLDPAIAAKIAGEKIDGIFWLVKLELESGDQYFAESGEFETGGHVWYPFLDPESPIDGAKTNLKCDEELETSITLVNVNHGLSDLLASNDFQGKTARIYLYFREIDELLQVFRGVMGKPERVGDLTITVPVSSYLSGPKSKLPSNLFTRTCPAVFADGKYCPYNPAGGYGIVDPVTGLPFTSCPKSSIACASRGMREAQGKDYFGGFERWSYVASGRLNNTGFLGIGRGSYTSKGELQDNFLGQAIPLVYGEVKFPAKLYFYGDESEFLLVGGLIAEGQLQGAVSIEANGQSTHDFKYPPWFTHGFPGQAMPVIGQYSADPFSGTSYAIIRIKDEVGIQPDRSVDMSVRVQGRIMRQYWRNGDHWSYSEGVYSQAPTDVWIDLIANPRGGLGLGYDVIDLDLNWERDYSNAIILDVDGVSRKRFTFNGVLLDHESAGDVLERIRDEFSMFFRDYGDSVRFGFIRPNQTSVFTFSEAARTIEFEEKIPVIEIWEKPASDIPNRMYFSFLDASNGFEKTTFHLESPEQIARIGKVVDETVYLKATTNIGQALRIASNRMERTISGNWFAEWRAPLKALAVEVGDVVTLVTDLLPNGSDTFLVTEKEITPDFSIRFVGQLYRGEFYDDAVADTFDDILRGSPENPLRPPAEVTGVQAEETVVTVDGVNTSEIKVTYAKPDPVDPIWKEVEVCWRDGLSQDTTWTSAATSSGTEAVFRLPIIGYRMLHIKVRSVSRYGIRRDLDSTDVPEVDLLVDGTPDNNVPAAIANLTVKTSATEPTVPPGFYRVGFDAGAANWAGVHTIFVEANQTLPFSDGSLIPSGGFPVSGNGVIQAGGNSIFCAGKTWTPDDPILVGSLAVVTDAGGNVQARIISGNTADTLYTNGPWYLPDGTYAFEARTDFTKINYRWFMFEAVRGDFSPAARSFQFDLPLTNTALYFRLTAYNAFGKAPWVVSDLVSNTSVDRVPAGLLAALTITAEGYAAEDGSQKSVGTITTFTPPDPLGNFSHIVLFADVPVPGKAEKERIRVGEFWGVGEVFVMEPTAAAVTFYAVSANMSGWYPEDWEEIGENVQGGYRRCDVVMSPDNNAPTAPATFTATFAALGSTIDLVWTVVAIPDLAEYAIQFKSAATEGGLATAEWKEYAFTRSTFDQYAVPSADSGKWFKFRIRTIDNIGNASAWAESANVRAFAGASVQPVSAPLNIGVTGAWEYRMGVPLSFISINWDIPADPNFGGVQVWIVDLTQPAGTLYDIVKAPASSSTVTLLMDSHVLKVRLIPFNKAGIVPDFGTYLESPTWTNAPATFGYTVPAPDITARDGIGNVHLQVEIPAWAGMSNPYSSLLLFISKTDSTSGAQLVGRWPVNNASGYPERMFVDIPFQALADVTGGPWPTGEQYYFFGKLEVKDGGQSAFSVDTDYSAVFLDGGRTEDGVPDFAAGAEVMRVAASDRFLFIGWNAPTVNGATVYLSQLQVARDSGFTSLIEDSSVNAKSGSKGIGLPENGTYYLRVRYRNNSATGWSEWFGLKEGTASATVQTRPDQAGDSGYIDGATKLSATYTTLTQQDALRVAFKMSSSALNCATFYNLTALWSDTQSKLDDANYVIASLTLSWLDNDSWISTGTATPDASWIGKILQYRYNASPALWISGRIDQIDAVNKRVQLNVSWGAAKSGQTGRVVTPYWARVGVFFKEVGEDTGWHLEKNVDYYLPQINQYPSGTTVYFRLIPVNIFGPGTAYDFNVSVGSTAGDVVTKGQGYAHDSAPTGTFSSGGYQWVVTAPNTVDFLKTFTYTQAADANYRADSFVVVVRPGGGTPDPATDIKLVFPVSHASGAQAYSLKIPNLDPFATYSFRVYGAKSCASGMILGTGSTLTDTNLKYTTANDLILKTLTSSGRVICRDDQDLYFTPLFAGALYLRSTSGAITVLPAAEMTTIQGTGTSTLALTLRTADASPLTAALRFRFDNAASALQIWPDTAKDLHLGDENGTGDVHAKRKFNMDAGADVTGELAATAGLTIKSAGYQYPLKLGGFCLWVNATSGKLYIKNGTPTSDTDGTIVGTQS